MKTGKTFFPHDNFTTIFFFFFLKFVKTGKTFFKDHFSDLFFYQRKQIKKHFWIIFLSFFFFFFFFIREKQMKKYVFFKCLSVCFCNTHFGHKGINYTITPCCTKRAEQPLMVSFRSVLISPCIKTQLHILCVSKLCNITDVLWSKSFLLARNVVYDMIFTGELHIGASWPVGGSHMGVTLLLVDVTNDTWLRGRETLGPWLTFWSCLASGVNIINPWRRAPRLLLLF